VSQEKASRKIASSAHGGPQAPLPGAQKWPKAQSRGRGGKASGEKARLGNAVKWAFLAMAKMLTWNDVYLLSLTRLRISLSTPKWELL